MKEQLIRLRHIERISALGIAGLSFILGFLLFLFAPEAEYVDTADIKLFKLRLGLANVGPGIFFALFGAAITIYSIKTRAKAKEVLKEKDGDSITEEFRYLQSEKKDNTEVIELRGAYQKDFRVFAEVADKLGRDEPISDSLKLDLENTLTNTKDTLMRNVWDESWGDYSTFKAWLAKGYPEPVPENIVKAAKYFLGK